VLVLSRGSSQPLPVAGIGLERGERGHLAGLTATHRERCLAALRHSVGPEVEDDDPALGFVFRCLRRPRARALERELEPRLLVPRALFLFPLADLLDDEWREHRVLLRDTVATTVPRTKV